MMKLKQLKEFLGVKTLELKKWKEDGAYLAEVAIEGKGTFKLFTTKASGKDINDDSPVTIIDGKYYIGEVKQALETIKV